MSLNSVLYDLVSAEKYFSFVSSLSYSFMDREEASAFDSEQIKLLISFYLEELTRAELLKSSLYPHTEVPRYLKVKKFHELDEALNVDFEGQFNPPFLLQLRMQRSLCNSDILECSKELEMFNRENKVALEDSKYMDKQALKEKLSFLQNKILAIDKLLGMYNEG